MFYCDIDNITVGYDGRPLLRNVRLGVDRGEILTLIGPNGVGKSTLLKSLGGQLRLLGGTVLLEGTSLNTLSSGERAKTMALMLTQAPRTELTSCFELVSGGRYPYTGRLGLLSREDREKVRGALELVGAETLADRDFSKISDGQRQRVLLARAICQEPDIILLDEPTSFLDIRGKAELLDILRRLARERHVAILMSLHELDLAQKVSDRVACVGENGITMVGAPEEVFTAAQIQNLYHIAKGSYDPVYGGMELEAGSGEPEVFVIGGAGQGIPLYRRLQRQGRPFAAGILYENDLDYPVACALAAQVIAQEAFVPVEQRRFREALSCMARCLEVWCVPQSHGAMNQWNLRLRQEAAALGKLKEGQQEKKLLDDVSDTGSIISDHSSKKHREHGEMQQESEKEMTP